jgi:hypothetical protein
MIEGQVGTVCRCVTTNLLPKPGAELKMYCSAQMMSKGAIAQHYHYHLLKKTNKIKNDIGVFWSHKHFKNRCLKY